MATALEPNKAKIAKRVIEVFEFFNENSQKATVMDIVRRYGRPQSSTSELLATLVEMGLLYKDSRSRYYSPTPRLAALGVSAQPEIIRNGHLFAFMDRLAQTTRNSVALFGMVGTSVQIFRLSAGPEPGLRDIGYGACEQLSASAAGLLLLSTLPPEQASRHPLAAQCRGAGGGKIQSRRNPRACRRVAPPGPCHGRSRFFLGAANGRHAAAAHRHRAPAGPGAHLPRQCGLDRRRGIAGDDEPRHRPMRPAERKRNSGAAIDCPS